MAKILIIRFSALGDVAMTVPIVHALATSNPTLDITVLSRSMCQPLFAHLPDNVHFSVADLHGKHKGIQGLNVLLKDLDYRSFDYVADFHNVLRSKWLRWKFFQAGKKVAAIDKGRNGKWILTRKRCKRRVQQKTSFDRYADVLAKLGFAVQSTFTSVFDGIPNPTTKWTKSADDNWIGIAPFAKHIGKIYPIDKMEQVVKLLSQQDNTTLFFFGAGNSERTVLEDWGKRYKNSVSLAGKSNLTKDLEVMNQLDVMVSMDSANMHLASLTGTPVVSIWGATHPYAGFLGWKQKEENAVQLDLKCRPCSVFGNKPCHRGDYACLNNITPEMIVERINANLK